MRGIAAFALALCLLGCTSEVKLLTGGSESHGLPFDPVIRGLLLSDDEFGTVISVEAGGSVGLEGRIQPVNWPEGYSGRRVWGGEVEVLNREGAVVATTGRRYLLPVCYYQIGGVVQVCGGATEVTGDSP